MTIQCNLKPFPLGVVLITPNAQEHLHEEDIRTSR